MLLVARAAAAGAAVGVVAWALACAALVAQSGVFALFVAAGVVIAARSAGAGGARDAATATVVAALGLAAGDAIGALAMVSSAHAVSPWRALDALGAAKVLSIGHGLYAAVDGAFAAAALALVFALVRRLPATRHPC